MKNPTYKPLVGLIHWPMVLACGGNLAHKSYTVKRIEGVDIFWSYQKIEFTELSRFHCAYV